MTKNIDKKKYEKPSMEVILLESMPQLLAGSDDLPFGGPWPGEDPW